MAQVLVTGGAGYVGSHIVRRLLERGHAVTVVDDLSAGHREAVGAARLVVADFADRAALDALLGAAATQFVVHMAASCEVGASVVQPAAYYANNVVRSLALLDAAREHGVRGVVFSSSAAVYGEPNEVPIPETHPVLPTNPYGETKLVIERALRWHGAAYALGWVALRYFNAAGAHPDGTIGEDHATETHLIPRLLRARLVDGAVVPVFGTDYPTPDGTCVRDYVHVADLAEAHVLALEALDAGRIDGASFNLGNGVGFSVREVVAAVERVTGAPPPLRFEARRPGDPSRLVASSARARAELGWKPAFPELDAIVATAWRWHRTHPRGYGESRGG